MSAANAHAPTTSAAAAGGVHPPPPSAAPAAAAEDAAAEAGESIATFSEYSPSALPRCVLDAVHGDDGRGDHGVGRVGDHAGATATSDPNNRKAGGHADGNADDEGEDRKRQRGEEKHDAAMTMTPSQFVVGDDNNDGREVIEIIDTSCSSFEDAAASAPRVTASAASPSSIDAALHQTIEIDDDDDDDDEEEEEEDVAPAPDERGDELRVPSHTCPACESALLASVRAPQPSEGAALCLLDLARTKALSPLQLEGVCLAINRHNRLLLTDASPSPSPTARGLGVGGGGGNNKQPAPSSSSSVVRAGFFIGDGAGIGKGRQIASVLRDSMCRGRTRHLWLSVSRELALDAERDLRDVGVHCPVHDGAELLDQTSSSSSSSVDGTSSGAGNGKRKRGGKGLGVGGGLGRGVLFVTYALLVSGQNGRRMEEIVHWLSGGAGGGAGAGGAGAEASFDGCIVFDEAHRAKNLDAETRTAKLVITLQRRLPRARVLYCSATGVSDVKHMVYAERLALWGISGSDVGDGVGGGGLVGSGRRGGSLFHSFDHFRSTLDKRGVGSLEMLALEMKQMGSFVARTLSWDGAEFETREVPLDENQARVYDGAVRWWRSLKDELGAVLRILSDAGSPPNRTVWKAYWSAHQRFFREMAICAKVPWVADDAIRVLGDGCAVVVGLQSTGEAGTQNALEELRGSAGSSASGGPDDVDVESMRLPQLISTAGSCAVNFARNHFPVAPLPPEPPRVPAQPANGFGSAEERELYLRLSAEAERISAAPPPEPLPELLERRRRVIEMVSELDLPPNPLDDLIDRLGGTNEVAEMTGRSGRIVRAKGRDNNYFRFAKRGNIAASKRYGLSMPDDDDTDRLNIAEKKKFMDGRKRVAIISDAASTGISLHAARSCLSSGKRRVHYTIELPWAADKAIQQLGRTHRSGQESAPVYKMVVTDLGGERRFAAAVSKRMSHLGALTKGDRRAATGSDLSEFDVDSRFGKRALKRVFEALGVEPLQRPSRNSDAILDVFMDGLVRKDDPAVKYVSNNASLRRGLALELAKAALDEIGLGIASDSRKNSEVKVFLNRIAGLTVDRQNLVFSLFMSALDDVVTEAKATGEFEGSVEDIKATSITLQNEEVLAIDQSSGAPTKLTKLVVDRGISFSAALDMSLECAHSTQRDKPIDSCSQVDTETGRDQSLNKVFAISGFYASKRKIAGRTLVLFAKRKIDVGTFETIDEAKQYDPLGLMVVTRPNTGTNPCEMTSRDLRVKYRRIITCEEVKALMCKETSGAESRAGEGSGKPPLQVMSKASPDLTETWNRAFQESDKFDNIAGLAPRRSRLGIVTGAVLHVLPALEKAVAMRRQSERALKVLRVEVTSSGQRLVGIRFPVDDDAVGKLKLVLKDLKAARSDAGVGFYDEGFIPIDRKSMEWATTERKTMKSFFGASSSATRQTDHNKHESTGSFLPSSGLKSTNPPPRSVSSNEAAARFLTPSNAPKTLTRVNKVSATSKKKPKSIMSFFGAKR